jgi:isopentenyl-diphosphate delta-isomerase
VNAASATLIRVRWDWFQGSRRGAREIGLTRTGSGLASSSLPWQRQVEEVVMERVVLVDDADREIGSEEKMAAHQAGLLHRAFSVFVFNRAGEMLLQRRSRTKYHSGGKWSNACCGHPRPGEALEDGAHRRLREEMGFDCALRPLSVLRYTAELDHGLVENEIDHVLVGEHEGDPRPDPAEAEAWRWVDGNWLERSIAASPGEFTVWFRLILEHVSFR